MNRANERQVKKYTKNQQQIHNLGHIPKKNLLIYEKENIFNPKINIP
jgi:hypothetical protein